MSILENSIEIDPRVAEQLLTQTPLLKWLLGRVKTKGEVDSNKQYASELLAILVQVRAGRGRAGLLRWPWEGGDCFEDGSVTSPS